ncbi:MAG: hypothetical protein F6K40_17525 [Okeania sp. SIO3I5]|uniref:hypothetical protein n=1 Tax=Okeania sp. SIO3I5 TaxID=2607805 RepID=UPI0013B78D5C|nr:hypothetical protein [Okeania sp. SIO3I5]NEQ37966.1 hypothetical protein [Okeania sp. SIO3I5]
MSWAYERLAYEGSRILAQAFIPTLPCGRARDFPPGKLKKKYVNANAAIKELLENSYKNDGKNETIIVMIGSRAIALTEIVSAVSRGVRGIRSIMTFVGVPVGEKNFEIKLPFNLKALYKEETRKVKKGKKTETEKKLVLSEEPL